MSATPTVKGEGSSPLTRGKHLPAYWVPAHAGLIPAHAGKTPQTVSACRRSRAHPRSRGENVEGCFSCHGLIGSSPLTRGKLADLPGSDHTLGLIPAHAGKTASSLAASEARAAHPRSRGENGLFAIDEVQDFGSSPLTRGKRTLSSRFRTRLRLIPAHAGKTRVNAGTDSLSWAHPRSRGENGD